MASRIEQKIKKLEADAIAAMRVDCRDRRRVVDDLVTNYDRLFDDVYSINDGALARKLAGKTTKAVHLVDRAQRSLENRCAGLHGTSRRRRRRK